MYGVAYRVLCSEANGKFINKAHHEGYACYWSLPSYLTICKRLCLNVDPSQTAFYLNWKESNAGIVGFGRWCQ